MSYLRSPERLASHFFSIQELLEIMIYPWFCYFKAFYQRINPNNIIAFALTVPNRKGVTYKIQ